MRLTFANHSRERACILVCFEPLPVFFTFYVTGGDGTPVSMPGGGKIAFGPEPLQYVGLNAGDNFAIDVDLAPLLPRDMVPGTYTLSAEYHNQYGKEEAQRTLQSNTVSISLTGGTR